MPAKSVVPPPPPHELIKLFPSLHQTTFERGSIIFGESSRADTCFFLLEGKVQINKKIRGKAQRLKVATVRPGEFFGEMSMLAGLPRSANAIALTEVKVLKIPRAEFVRQIRANNPTAAQVALHFATSLAWRGMQTLRLLGRSYGSEATTAADQVMWTGTFIVRGLIRPAARPTRAASDRSSRVPALVPGKTLQR